MFCSSYFLIRCPVFTPYQFLFLWIALFYIHWLVESSGTTIFPRTKYLESNHVSTGLAAPAIQNQIYSVWQGNLSLSESQSNSFEISRLRSNDVWYENGILCEIKRLAQNILLAVYAVSIVTYELEFLRTTVDDGSQNQSFRKSYSIFKGLAFICLFVFRCVNFARQQPQIAAPERWWNRREGKCLNVCVLT